MPSIPSSSSSSKQPQSKRAIFGSYLNQLTEITNINNLRQIQATYDPRQAPETLKLQLLIKAQKGLVTDSEALGRDSHMVSKQLYLWASEQPDQALKDVGDRLAYMTYQVGDLQQHCSKDLEQARADLKEIRNFENELVRLRERDKALESQIQKLLQDSRPKHESKEKLSSMTAEHSSVTEKLKELERSTPAQRRKLIQSSYHTQFRALREMADKLLIVTQFGDLLLDELDQDPQLEYTGQDRTALVKGAASQALLDYQGPIFSKPNIGLAHPDSNQSSTSTGSSSVHRADTRLFGETHPHVLANSLDALHSSQSHVESSSPPMGFHPTPPVASTPFFINHQPAPVPHPSSATSTQPPKLPSRPSETGKLTSQSPGSLGSLPPGPQDHHQASLDYKPPIDQIPPTVAEVGDHIPTSTNGPSHGSLNPDHPSDHPDQLPAYSVAPEKS